MRRPAIRRMRRCAATAVLAVALLALLALPAGVAPLHAADAETSYRDAATAFHNLRTGGQATPGQWRAVAEDFGALHAAAPASRRGADAQYSAALSYREAWRAGGEWLDLSRALATFRAFVAEHPQDRLADDALMHTGSLLADGYHDLTSARETYRRLLDAYPDGDQESAARHRLQAVEGAIAAAAERERAARLAAAAQAGQPKPEAAAVPAGENDPVVAAADEATRAAQRELAALKAAELSPDAPAAGHGPAQVKAVQYWSALEWTRVILTADPGVRWEVNRLPASGDRPERVYFDLHGAQPAEALAALTAVDDAVLDRIRISRFDDDTTRVVLDLNRMERFEVKDFRLATERKLVVDLHPPAEVIAAQRERLRGRQVATAPAAVAPGAGTPERQPQPVANRVLPEPSVQVPLALPVRAIMIDPGHGGHDPGASAYGLDEKDLVLDISRRLRDLLKQRHPELKVALTRDDDEFIPLGERPQIAKRFGADLFVSVHLNANPIRRFYGVETYFLNLTRDRDALQVAARENATSEQRVNDLNDILRDLLRDTTLVESSELAKQVQASLVGALRDGNPVRDLGVKQAPFLVLMGAEMPSVLVEAGFLTNRDENRRLRDPDYLDRLAEGIYDGLRRYIEQQNIIAVEHAAGSVAATGRF